MTKAIAIIPARSGSKGLPGKNLMMLRGQTLLERAIETCQEAERIEDVYVSSDSDEILNVAFDAGAGEITRSPHLSDDDTTSKEVIDHALEKFNFTPHITCMVQCTTPGLRSRDLDRSVQLIQEGMHKSSFTGFNTSGNQWAQFRLSQVKPETSHIGVRVPRQKKQKLIEENGGVYSFETVEFKQSGHRFPEPVGAVIMPPELSVDIDTPFDLECAKAGLSRWNVRSNRNALPREVQLVVLDHDGVLTDGTVSIGPSGQESYNYYTPDGHGIGLLRRAGIDVVIASSQRRGPVETRADQLQVPCITSREEKIEGLEAWMYKCKHAWEHTVYLGNDVNDQKGIEKAAASFCPSDAHKNIKISVDSVLDAPGGRGAVRELCDTILEEVDAHNSST